MLTYAWIGDPSSCNIPNAGAALPSIAPSPGWSVAVRSHRGGLGQEVPTWLPHLFSTPARNNCPHLDQTHLRCSGFTSQTVPCGFTGTCFPFSLSVARIRAILLCSSLVFLSWLSAQRDSFSRPIFFYWPADIACRLSACTTGLWFRNQSFIFVFFVILGFGVHNYTLALTLFDG